MGKRTLDESDTDDSDDDENNDKRENEESIVLNNGNDSDSNKVEGSSDSVTGRKRDGESSIAGSSESCSEEEKETVINGKMESIECLKTESLQAAPSNVVEPVLGNEVASGSSSESVDLEIVAEEAGKQDSGGTSSGKLDLANGQVSIVQIDGMLEHKASCHEETSTSAPIPETEQPLNFDAYNSAAELEVCLKEQCFCCALSFKKFI